MPTDKAFRSLLVQLGGPDRAEDKFRENPRLLIGVSIISNANKGFLAIILNIHVKFSIALKKKKIVLISRTHIDTI